MQTFLLVAHVLMAVGLIGLILVQHGKGADTGAAFGVGASATIFGSRGSASFLSRMTAGLAILFFANSLLLAHLASSRVERQSLMERVQLEETLDLTPEEPAAIGESDLPPISDESDLPSLPGD